MRINRLYIVLLLIFCVSYTSYSQSKLSLNDAKTLALKNNAKVKNAKLEYDVASNTKDEAYTKYFPNVSVTGAYVRAFDDLIKFNMQGGNLPVFDGKDLSQLANATQFAYFPGVNLSLMDKMGMAAIMAVQPIYAGGRIDNGNKLADINKDVNQEKINLTRNDVLLQTEEQYWLIYSLVEKMKTVDMYEHLLDTLNKNVNDAYNSGLVSRNDVLKVQLKLNEVKINKLKLNNGTELAKMAFAQHIGIEYNPNISLTDAINGLMPPDSLLKDHKSSLSNRSEYKMLQKGVEAEKLQTEMKRGELLPQLSVGVNAFYYNAMDMNKVNGMVFGMISIPISDWWGGSYAIQEHKVKEEIMKNNEKETSELLIVQMNKAWFDLVEAYKQISLAEDMIKQAEENVKVNQSNFSAGVINISDLLEAQASLQQTRDQMIEFQKNYKIAIVKYLQVTGRYE